MSLFDRTEKHLATGPTLLVPAEQVETVTEWVHRYAPEVARKSDRFSFRNGVFLYGPVETSTSGLVGYYVRPASLPKGEDRPEDEKMLDGEQLVRGLAVRLGGQKQSRQPWADLELEVSVYAEQPAPVEQVIAVLRPFAGTDLRAKDYEIEGGYILLGEEQPVFHTLFAPARVSRLPAFRPALATGAKRQDELCRWELGTTSPAAAADPELCRLVASAGFALASAVNGSVVDMFGFPLASAGELLPA